MYDFKEQFLGTGSRSYSYRDCIVYHITYIDVGIEANACAHSADTIRYDTIRYEMWNQGSAVKMWN